MSVFRIAVTAVGAAVTLARHPMVRAGIRAAPRLVTPQMREQAAELALSTAYRAGVAARRLTRREAEPTTDAPTGNSVRPSQS